MHDTLRPLLASFGPMDPYDLAPFNGTPCRVEVEPRVPKPALASRASYFEMLHKDLMLQQEGPSWREPQLLFQTIGCRRWLSVTIDLRPVNQAGRVLIMYSDVKVDIIVGIFPTRISP
jgi:hypothetical protein